MRIVDLFSGAGGLTFGFYYLLENNTFVHNGNCEIVFANEVDQSASETFRRNFPNVEMLNCDIRQLTADSILARIGNEPVDIIIGGPPCQSFSTIGRRVYDDKARLYEEYLRLLSIIRPKMFLFENVKGMLSMRNDDNDRIIDVIRENFEHIQGEFGYRISYRVLNAVNYGVPQSRERVFIIGIRNDQNLEWNFDDLEMRNEDPLTIEAAISDLPEIEAGEAATEYNLPPQNLFQTLMRRNSDVLTHHFSNVYSNKIQTVINNVIPGEGRNYVNNLVDGGLLGDEFRLTSGYANTYGRLVQNKPCTTITNNMCCPSALRCIHYVRNRALTPREGARIQSFPDWFHFCGCKGKVTMQIGNAVPPLMAMSIARSIENLLEN